MLNLSKYKYNNIQQVRLINASFKYKIQNMLSVNTYSNYNNWQKYSYLISKVISYL